MTRNTTQAIPAAFLPFDTPSASNSARPKARLQPIIGAPQNDDQMQAPLSLSVPCGTLLPTRPSPTETRTIPGAHSHAPKVAEQPMNNVMAYPGFPGPGPNAGQGVPNYPFPASGLQGQLTPQLGAQRQQQQHGFNPEPGASMLPPQKPNAPGPAAHSNASAHNVNAQSFATPPISTPLQPQTSQTQAPPSQATAQTSSMANSTATATANAAPTSAKTTSTSEAPPQSSPQQAHKLSPKDEKRVAALLHLNNVIIKELSALQASGPDKPQSPSQPSNPTGAPAVTSPSTILPSPAGASTTPTDPNAPSIATAGTPTSATTPTARAAPTKKQITDNYSRRLQVNIAYLLGMSQNKPVPSFPQAMEPPPEAWIAVAEGTKEEQKERWEEMKDGYGKLKECWPEYRLGMRPQIPAAMNQGSNQGQAAAQQGAGQAGQHGGSQVMGQGQQQQQHTSAQAPGNAQGNTQAPPHLQQNPQAQTQNQGFAPTTTTQQAPAQPQSQT